MTTQDTLALTDLALGAALLLLALDLRRRPGVPADWIRVFGWGAAAALAGTVHHTLLTRFAPGAARVSWALISTAVVVSVSYILAGTVDETLGRDPHRVFAAVRWASVAAFAALAALGHSRPPFIAIVQIVPIGCVVALWARAWRRRHPMARWVLLALAANGAAGVIAALPRALTDHLGLDPASATHLAEIPAMLVLAAAVRRSPRIRRRPRPATVPAAAGPTRAGRTTSSR